MNQFSGQTLTKTLIYCSIFNHLRHGCERNCLSECTVIVLPEFFQTVVFEQSLQDLSQSTVCELTDHKPEISMKG